MAITEFEINLTNLENIQSIKEFVEEELNNNKIKITKDIWRSKYNKFVIYDYEPFCTSGFEHLLCVEGEANYMEFISKVIKNKLDKYLALEKIYNTSDIQEKKENITWKFL